MDEQPEKPRSRRALGGDSLVTGTVAGDTASETADAGRLGDEQPDEQPEQLDGEQPQAGVPQCLPRDPQPTFPDGSWAHWTDWL